MNRISYLIFFGVLLLVLLLGSVFLAYRANQSFASLGRRPWIAYSAVLLFVLFEFLTFFWIRFKGEEWGSSYLWVWTAQVGLGAFVTLLLYCVFSDSIVWISRMLGAKDFSASLGRRAFLGSSVAAGVSLLTGGVQAANGPKVREIEIPIRDLPEDLEGFRIVQLSDLHMGPLIQREYVESVVERSLKLMPDLIALTGDFVDGEVTDLAQVAEPLRRLTAPHGTFFITGNHEYYSGVEEWMKFFREMGFRVLQNENHVFTKGNAKFAVAGVYDYSAPRSHPAHAPDPVRAFQGIDPAAFKLFLAHQPQNFEEASQLGAHLQLSGHTHAGQFFPWRLIVALAYRYSSGLYRHGKMWIYVHAGTGWWGPPNRFTVPSEIALFRLKREAL